MKIQDKNLNTFRVIYVISIFIKKKFLHSSWRNIELSLGLNFLALIEHECGNFGSEIVCSTFVIPFKKYVYKTHTSSVHTCSNNFKGRQQKTVFRVREYHRDYPKAFLVFES